MKFLILVAEVAIIVYVVSRSNGRRNGSGREATGPTDEALRILRERYAKGEKDFATYEKMRDDFR